MFNKVILIGYLTRDIDLRYSPAGLAIAKTGIATNRKFKDKFSDELKEETMFIDITVFGRSAEVANQYLKKGSKVLLEGRLVFEQWIDSTGKKRSKHSVVAEKIQFLGGKSGNSPQQDTQHYTSAVQPQQNPNPSPASKDRGKYIEEEDIPF